METSQSKGKCHLCLVENEQGNASKMMWWQTITMLLVPSVQTESQIHSSN